MMAIMTSHGVQAVEDFGDLLLEMLQRAEVVKQTNAVEPPLNQSDFRDLLDRVEKNFFPSGTSPELRKRVYAVIETAARDVFNSFLASTSTNTSNFVKLWNLFDIISILSDIEQCDFHLLFWLVEELLDSQPISGCRKIFDYLDSRREKITAKHFDEKKLIILRSCNELLRRLSRAEDTAFCGRVFIFLFQSFPLGDKSSVNLRGEYHLENVTAFDKVSPKESDKDEMDVDSETSPRAATNSVTTSGKPTEEPNSGAKGVTFIKNDAPMAADELYPIFWSLQESFNQPKKLFASAHFAGFRIGLEATMVMFKSIQSEANGRPVKVAEDGKRGTKRKRSEGEDDLANAFNPKYLTSRDLFELEISDLSFRRHILVQVLIILDFLLSLSKKAKEKLAKAILPEKSNRSVIYEDQALSEDDTVWAIDMKRTIADYLKQGHEGAFFYRMVETVLSRDKNWVRWKIENCPPISKEPVSCHEYVQAKAAVKKHTANKRIRPTPLASLDLKFLSESENTRGLDRLKDPKRYQIPSFRSFKNKIELDDMDIDMARDDEAKNAAIESKASKSWRALRIASTTNLTSFDKIEKSDKIDAIFQEEAKTEEADNNVDEETLDNEDAVMPKDLRPIVISGPSGVGKGTLISMLLEKHGSVLGRKPSHTTRPERAGEVHGQHYFFVAKEAYDVLRDGDEFIEYNNFNGYDYGTSRKVVDDIITKGKVPLMEMDMHGITQLKDQSFAARYIFLAPPDISELQQRLRQRGSNTEDKIKDRLEIAEKELAQAKVEGFHDKILVNDNLQTAFEQLESYIFGFDATDEDGKDAEAVSTELEMGDGELQIDDGKLNDDVEAGDKIAAPAEDIAMAADAHDTTGTADRLNTE